MKCMNCTETISSKFAHAITKNECPYCGEDILTAELKDILVSLGGIMEKAKEYPDEISEFLLSNFQFKKVNGNVNQEEVEGIPDIFKKRPMNKSSVIKRAGEEVIGRNSGNLDYPEDEDLGSDMESDYPEDDLDMEDYGSVKTKFNLITPESFLDGPGLKNNELQELANIDLFPQKKTSGDLEIERLKRLRSQNNFDMGNSKIRRKE